MHAWPSRPPAHSALPIAPLAHCAPGTRGSAMPRELPEHWLTAASSTRGMASSSSSVSDNGRSTRPCTARRNRPTSISGRDDRPVPAHVVPVVWREHALVEHLERRLEQRRPGPLQDHRALVRKRRGDRPIAAARWQRATGPRPGLGPDWPTPWQRKILPLCRAGRGSGRDDGIFPYQNALPLPPFLPITNGWRRKSTRRQPMDASSVLAPQINVATRSPAAGR